MSKTRTVRLGDIAIIERKSVQPSKLDGTTYYLGLEHIQKGGRIIDRSTVGDSQLKSSKFQFTDNHILYGKLRPYLAKIASPAFSGVCSTDILPIKPGPAVDKDYLFYYLRQPHMVALANKETTGANLPRISPKALAALPIELPIIEQQKKLAEQYRLQDLITQKRERQQELLKELKTAVFSTMFEGKDYPILSLNEISLGKGTYGANLASEEYNSDKPRYIRITDINDDGSLNNDLRSPAGNNSDWEKYILKPGDLLFARSGATVGKTFLVQDETQKAIHAGYLIKFKLNRNLVNPDYIFSYTQTAAYKAWVKSKQNVVAQPNINAKQYGQELKIPIPPLAHQNKFSKIIGKI